MAAHFMRRFSRDRKGNVAVIFALALVPTIFLIGMALDFASAMQKRTQLNAAADAAALAAVTPAMMKQTTTTAKAAASNIFKAEASAIGALTYNNPTINVTSTNGGLTRTVTVSYTASSINNFPNVLGQSTWPLSGSSQATATTAPNIDFYLLLDNSPSMAIAATTAGINTMVNATKNAPSNGENAGGCAFACHETNPAADNLGNPGGIDNYQLAKNLGVVTRIQNLASATQTLMTTATSMEASNNSQYRMAIYTFNFSGTTTIQALTSNLTTAKNSASTIDVLPVYKNNWLTSSNNNSDADTDFNSAMSQINGIMPNPGTGTSGSSPQEVLFIVSDGVDDKVAASCPSPAVGLSGNRCQQPFSNTWCTTVKNRGILIAVLYTVYYPLPGNAWYNQWIAPFQNQIATQMQNCATPGLYFAVSTDDDITAAMQALFAQAVATARLSN